MIFISHRRSSIGTFIRPHSSEGTHLKPKPQPPKLDYRSMVSIDDMPELFVSFDSKYFKFKPNSNFLIQNETSKWIFFGQPAFKAINRPELLVL